MKILSVLFIFLMMAFDASAGEGVCRARAGKSHVEGLCGLQSQGDLCKINPDCEWISLSNQGVCLSKPSDPHMTGLCENQGKTGMQFCKMTNGCRWVELEDNELGELSQGKRTGVCRVKPASNQAMSGLCRTQAKDFCKMNVACYWISIVSKGVCQNEPDAPHMAALCENQGKSGVQFCKMTNGCRWIELN